MKKMELFMGIIMLCIVYAFSINAKGKSVGVYNQTKDNIVVLVDAGHGGDDPGKVSLNNDLEKDINLAIALKLEEILRSQNIEVLMTRREDKGLHQEGASNKKISDMKTRTDMANKNNVDIVISIHSNSYVDGDVCGAQVFYYGKSEKGEKLAKFIQNNVSKVSVLNSKRSAKANSDYYIIKNVSNPAVIVECGFLSNVAETALLKNEDYQRKIAWSIHMGILEYLNEEY